MVDKKNEGSIATRRRGLELSSSEYIMFVDADDWIDKNTVESLLKETNNEQVDVVVCNMFKVLGNGLLIKKKNTSTYFDGNKVYNKGEIRNNLKVAYFHGHPFPSSLCAKLYKRHLLINSGNFLDRIVFLGDDLFYNLEILLKANQVKLLDKPFYYYRLGGFTSKFMPHLFNDMINGYKIQKEVIDEYYQESIQKQYNGISIMLLNTFKTCLYNLFFSQYTESEIKELIAQYVENACLVESINNQGSIKYFPKEYLNAIRVKDIEYLYSIGKSMYEKNKSKRIIINILSRLSII